jgi:hypothetical protein
MMRYYHRTALGPDEVLAEADAHFGGRVAPTESTERTRVYKGTMGEIRLSLQADGGHYTLTTVTTDQVGESEADKFAKRFLVLVHRRVDRRHVVRGAY